MPRVTTTTVMAPALRWGNRTTRHCLKPGGIGAKVVFESTPLHEVGLYNGITGTITDVVTTDTDLILPIIYITKYDLKVVVHPYTEEIMTEASGTTAPTVQAHRTQFPFSIAEATTVHKVQGQTLDVAVEVDLKDMTSSGQIYTALSRLTKFENLTIKNLPAVFSLESFRHTSFFVELE